MTGPEREAEASAPRGASPVYHGGDLTQARRRRPDLALPWIDLSTGINPRPWPVPALTPQAWTRLPEAAAVATLEQAAAEAFGVPEADGVAATPGTQAAIQMLPRLAPGASVGILGFTYQEHAHAWASAGRTVEVVETLEELARFDVAVIVNPNNPDGRVVSADALAAFAIDRVSAARRLIVDEAFVDVLEEGASLAPRLPLPGTIVLRSFGKTWGLAGVRLGFVLADAAFAARVRAAFGPWAIGGPAIEIGRAALADRAWLEATRARLAGEVVRLDGLIEAAGLAVVGGTPLYRLGRGPGAGALFERLADAAIHVRRFPHAPELLRFGLPGSEAEWDRLAAATRG